MKLQTRIENLEKKLSSGRKKNSLVLFTDRPDYLSAENEKLKEEFYEECRKKNIKNPVLAIMPEPKDIKDAI